MKTDADSEEAEEPPGKTPGEGKENLCNAYEKNDELEWARRHTPQDSVKQQDHKPEASMPPAASASFRKTEFWNRAPLIRSEEPVMRKGLGQQADELHDRIDALEDRIELAIYRIEWRISKLEEKGRS
jgi:hypothetical protein